MENADPQSLFVRQGSGVQHDQAGYGTLPPLEPDLVVDLVLRPSPAQELAASDDIGLPRGHLGDPSQSRSAIRLRIACR
jgi:hypothetical protein